MKKKFVNGSEVYVHEYRNYTSVLYLNEGVITNFAIVSPDNITIATGDVFDDKNPNGMPNTPHFRKKIQNEIEELLENQVFNIGEVIVEETIINEGE